MRHYYAIQYTYGRACDDNGCRVGRYFRFDSYKERDEWCDDGPSYTSEPGYREKILSKDSELRKILSYDTTRFEADGEVMF